MAIFSLGVTMIKRSEGRSVVAASSYQHAANFYDVRLGRRHSFARRRPPFWAKVIAPTDNSLVLHDPEHLWNTVEACEVRRDAQLARCLRLVLPLELDASASIRLVEAFVAKHLTGDGMIVDALVRLEKADGSYNPVAMLIATTRRTIPGVTLTFGEKERTWNSKTALSVWRTGWADMVNGELEAADIEARVDHRSLKDQGQSTTPQIHVGIAAKRRHERGLVSDRVSENAAIIDGRTIPETGLVAYARVDADVA